MNDFLKEEITSFILMASMELRTSSKKPWSKEEVIELAIQYGARSNISREDIEAALERTLWDLISDA